MDETMIDILLLSVIVKELFIFSNDRQWGHVISIGISLLALKLLLQKGHDKR
jgi:hypothetical protein